MKKETKINYDTLSEITVKAQKELDVIPLDFKGRIYVEFGDCFRPAIVRNDYHFSVVFRGNSRGVFRENSRGEFWGNSRGVFRGNSRGVASGNAQLVDCLQGAKLQISGNARIVYNPKSVHEYLDFYGIKHDKKKAVMYKAVRKADCGKYVSDYNGSFEYIVGEKKSEVCDTNIDCGSGIHVAHLGWALTFGSEWSNLAILEVETKISDIVLPTNSDGKVRTSEVEVLREVPLEECGICGEILAERIARNNQ